jgi:N,N'-diacetylchitobiose transport system permease protein
VTDVANPTPDPRPTTADVISVATSMVATPSATTAGVTPAATSTVAARAPSPSIPVVAATDAGTPTATTSPVSSIPAAPINKSTRVASNPAVVPADISPLSSVLTPPIPSTPTPAGPALPAIDGTDLPPPAGRPVTPGRGRFRPGRVLLNLAGLLVFVIFGFPVFWMVLTAFKRGVDVNQRNPTLVPAPGTLENFRAVFDRPFFWSAMRTSLMVTLLTVVLALVVGFLAATAVARFGFRGRKAYMVMILLVQMVPAEALIISMFKILDGWSLTNTVFGLTLAYLVFTLPFTIWTLRGFVANVPVELEEAAVMDGCSRLRAFTSVTLPLVAPGLVATGVFSFIQAWNEFLFALVIMDRPEHQTLPVWLQGFNEGAKGTDWGAVMAGSTVMAVPVIVFFLLVQRRVTSGLTAGAVKG